MKARDKAYVVTHTIQKLIVWEAIVITHTYLPHEEQDYTV